MTGAMGRVSARMTATAATTAGARRRASAAASPDRLYCDVCQCVFPKGTNSVVLHEQGKRHQDALAGRLAKRADADARK